MKIVLNAVWVNTAAVAFHAFFAVGHFGPPLTSRTYAVALTWLPSHAWGVLFAVGAVLTLAAPWCRLWGCVAVHLLAAVTPLMFAVALATSDVTRQSQGWGGPLLYLTPVILHGLLVWARYGLETNPARAVVESGVAGA